MLKFQHLFLIIVFFFIVIPASCQGYEKLSEEQVNPIQTELAKNFAHNFLSTLKDGKSYEFHDEATEVLIKNLTPEVQTQLYKYIIEQFGEYQSLEYAETRIHTPGKVTIVRFKGICDKSKGTPEIRVVLDVDNKIAGFWLRPWEEEMK